MSTLSGGNVVNVPIGIATLACGLRLLPRVPAERGRMPDLLGARTLALAIAALSLAIAPGPSWGWSSAGTVAAFLASAGLTAAFLRRSASQPIPVVELPLRSTSDWHSRRGR